MYISVYGTLRKNCRANSMLDNTEFIMKSKEKLPFLMINLGAFPGLIESNEDNEIVIETYKIKEDDKITIDVLDGYEGYPNFYNRKEVELSNGIKSNIYYLNDSNRYGRGRNNIITSGDWLDVKF